MSRRKRFDAAPHVTYGQLELRCPSDHPLGAVLATHRGVIHRLDRPVHDALPASLTPVTPGESLIFACDACRNANQRGHYELSYSTLIEALSAARLDTRAERHLLRLS